MTSAAQDSWLEIIQGMKDVIRKRREELLQMEPGALVDFSEYCMRVMDLEIEAHCFDAHVGKANNEK